MPIQSHQIGRGQAVGIQFVAQQFACNHQAFCGKFAYQGQMTGTKLSMVGSRYGESYPRIVVLSLDPPLGSQGAFVLPEQRMIDYVTTYEEARARAPTRPLANWSASVALKMIYPKLSGSARERERPYGSPWTTRPAASPRSGGIGLSI